MSTHGKLIHPQLFACADRVKIPQVGDDERNFKSVQFKQTVPHSFLQPADTYSKKYIKRISSDLSFSEDVIRYHAAHTLPYDKQDMWKAFDSTGIVQREPVKSKGIMGRCNQRGTEKKHLPCHIKTVSQHRLKPLKRKTKHTKPSEEQENDRINSATVQGMKVAQKLKSTTFLTQNDDDMEFMNAENEQSKSKGIQRGSTKWDEHLLMGLSKNTASWIVNERLNKGPQHDKLNRLLLDLYGESSNRIDTLIRDDASVSDLGSADATVDLPSRQSRQNPSHHTSTVSGQTKEAMKINVVEDDVNSQPLASFYRLPGGVRRSQRHLEKELAGAINTTARDISIPPKKLKPPPTLKDVINAGVGDKMYDTDNHYEQEWLSGGMLIPRKDSNILTFDTGNKYRTVKQDIYPADPRHWHSKDNSKKTSKESKINKEKLPHKGYRKWSQLPEPLENEASLSLNEAGYDAEAHREPDPITLKRHRSNVALVRVVDEWRTKWHLGNKWYDSSIDDLERDMSDINEHVRLQAIATIARAATYRPPQGLGVPLKNKIMKWRSTTTSMMIGLAGTFKKSTEKKDSNSKKVGTEGTLPDKLYSCVVKALHDTSMRVQVTAAMALYTLNRPNEEPPYEEARTILHNIIRVGNPPERWAAAQCLAHAGVCDSFVVGELVNQFFDSTNAVKLEQCVNLMSKLSENSMLVHSMIAEQLNSTCWQQRMMACNVLPKLHGLVNKDIMHKLANLMWKDWHHEVRRAAAQTLGKTGHGKEVHDDLHDRILTGSERDKADALHKIAHLGIMTARLLPAYLECFNDMYISVRLAAAKTAGILIIEDEKVLRKLLFLTQYDANWKVKAHAIQALGLIGKVTPPIRDAIIWALRFETEAGVRAEACSAVTNLHITGNDISYILQDKLLVEPDHVVRGQLVLALESMGVSSHGDMDMVQQIKQEVRRLCTRYNIASKIAQNEQQEDGKRQKKKYLAQSMPNTLSIEDDDDDDVEISMKSRATASHQSTRQCSARTTPSIVISIDYDLNASQEIPSQPGVSDKESHYSSSLSQRGSRASSPQQRTPEEKIEKLIDLYEGTCTIDEYKEFAHQKQNEENDEEIAKMNEDKLETIHEGGTTYIDDDTTNQDLANDDELLNSQTSFSTMEQSTPAVDHVASTCGRTDHSASRGEQRIHDQDELSMRPSTVKSDLTSNVESVDIELFEEAIEAIKDAQLLDGAPLYQIGDLNDDISHVAGDLNDNISHVASGQLSEQSQYDSDLSSTDS